ncbi:MAG: 50S ribosomal protein L13 [Patescibacteria group bacterium]
MTTIEFDAKDKVLGRLASDIAQTLRGKKTVTYRPDRLPDITVIVRHADQIAVTGTKEKTKFYYHFSGYPGGLSKQKLSEVRAKHPDRLLYQAVKRMLPDTKLRSRLLKRLVLEVAK